MRQVLWLAAAIAIAVGDTAGACPRMDPHQTVLTPPGSTVYETGGVIVATEFEFGDATDEHVVAAGKQLKRATYIAPQLSVFVVPAGETTIDITDDTGHSLRQLAVSPAPRELAAPVVKRIVGSAKPPRTAKVEWTRGVPATQTTIELREAPPADAYALLVFGPQGSNAQAWLPVDGKSKTYTLHTGGKACGNHTGGPMYRGDKVRIAWLDRGGRVSPLTRVFVLGK